MKNIKKTIIIFCFALLGVLSLNINNVNAASTDFEIQPRINIADVVSTYDEYTEISGSYYHTWNTNYTYTTIQYMNGYNSSYYKKNISTIIDTMLNRFIYRYIYSYTTY